MRAATQSAQINYHRNQQPQQINSRRRHAAVQFPCVYDRGERQENEAEYRQHQTAAFGGGEVLVGLEAEGYKVTEAANALAFPQRTYGLSRIFHHTQFMLCRNGV